MLETSDDSGDVYTARVPQPAEIVGLIEILSNCPLGFDVIASTECTVRAVSQKDLYLYLTANAETRTRLIRLLADLVRDADRYSKSL